MTRWISRLAFSAALFASFGTASALAAGPGLAVVLANDYDSHAPGATRDGAAIADAMEAKGFASVRIVNAASTAMPAGLDAIRKAAVNAGPFRLIYAGGFGACVNGELMLFADDIQPEQFQSGEISDVVVPLSTLRDAAGEGAGPTLIVFDGNPMQCTESDIKAIKLPEKTALMVTTGIGGDVVEEIEGSDIGAFATAFIAEYAPDRMASELLDELSDQIQTLSEGQQVPITVGSL